MVKSMALFIEACTDPQDPDTTRLMTIVSQGNDDDQFSRVHAWMSAHYPALSVIDHNEESDNDELTIIRSYNTDAYSVIHQWIVSHFTGHDRTPIDENGNDLILEDHHSIDDHNSDSTHVDNL